MDATDGLTRGQPVTDTGAQISVPVGPQTLGRILNVIGEPIDEQGPVHAVSRAPIHAKAPEFVDQSTESRILVTGIKVIDLKIGRAHVCTPVTNAHIVCRLSVENKTTEHI